MVADTKSRISGGLGKNTVFIRGAANIEPGMNDVFPTKEWVRGYFGGQGEYLYNFGSADGCPSADVPGTYDGQCGTEDYPNWRQSDIWYVSRGFANSRVFPEIYLKNGIHAEQWYQIAMYGVRTNQPRLLIMGSLSQYKACDQRPDDDGCIPTNPYLKNASKEGWLQLKMALLRDNSIYSDLPYLSDIEYQIE